jgi:hypothetical protein
MYCRACYKLQAALPAVLYSLLNVLLHLHVMTVLVLRLPHVLPPALQSFQQTAIMPLALLTHPANPNFQ